MPTAISSVTDFSGWRARSSVVLLIVLQAIPGFASAQVLRVPADHPTVQAALDAAQPGDRVEVSGGVFHEKVFFPRSGLPSLAIVLTAAAGESPVLDGTGVAGDNLVLIDSRSHVEISGFELRNNLGVGDGSGVRIVGAATDIVVRSNIIHEIRGQNAMGITVYGTESEPIRDLVIDGNQIYDCDPAQSEALTLNGNVTDFAVTGNLVRDVNNIGIDFIGGESDIQPDPALVARNGVVRNNIVLRANSSYGGGYGAGIYVDGGRDLVIENNLVQESDLGIEIGAENPGVDATGIVVRNNVLAFNERAGLVFGGYQAAVGRARDNVFRGNTLYRNNTVGSDGQGRYFVGGGIAEIWLQWGSGNIVVGNLVFAGPENVFVGSYDVGSQAAAVFDYNLYHSAGGVTNADFSFNGAYYQGLEAFRTATGLDQHSLVADPQLVDPIQGDFHLQSGSMAIDAGDPAYLPDLDETDLDGLARRSGGRIDIGADELDETNPIFADGFESGDKSRWAVGSRRRQWPPR